MKVNSTYKVGSWEEAPYDTPTNDTKLTKATITFDFNSDSMVGTAAIEYLMFTKSLDPSDAHKSQSIYLGFLRYSGTMNNRKGTFVMEDRGTFEVGTASSKLRVIEGSGTGDFANITGSGFYAASERGLMFELDFDLS